jgi:D-3-phosphoglycerate dehydrogenase
VKLKKPWSLVMKIYANTKTLDTYISSYVPKEEAEFLILGSRKQDIDEFVNLKGIFRCGVGRDNIPDSSVPIGFPSDKTRSILNREVASFTCAMIFKLVYLDLGSIGIWHKIEREALSEQTVLIIGLGQIGQQVVGFLSGHCRIESFDIDSREPLESMVRRADIITLHLPLTQETCNILNPSWFKTDVVIVNTARGNLINESALYDFLKENRRARAAFDVFWTEPYTGPLLQLPNFYASPHVASTCRQFFDSLYSDFLDFVRSIK